MVPDRVILFGCAKDKAANSKQTIVDESFLNSKCLHKNTGREVVYGGMNRKEWIYLLKVVYICVAKSDSVHFKIVANQN